MNTDLITNICIDMIGFLNIKIPSESFGFRRENYYVFSITKPLWWR